MTRDPAVIRGVSVAYQHASVEVIDRASATSQTAALEELLQQPGIAEAFALQTCNRAERYVVSKDPKAGEDALASTMADVPAEALTEMDHEESLRHLLEVAAGLESLVPGEDQVLGQVRDAYADAADAGAIGPVFEQAVTKAIHVGERARTETAINDGVVSLGSAAVELADEQCDLADATALVVGAGEIANLAAKALSARADIDHLVVANRTVSNAEHVVSGVDMQAKAVGLDELPAVTETADLVVSATASPQSLFDVETVEKAGATVIVDIGQPRDVPTDVDHLENVSLFDLDDLESVTAETRASRQAAADTVADIVEAEFDHLLTRYKRTQADDVISTMYESAERVKDRELREALAKLDLDEEEHEVVEAMADSLVNQLLAPPTKSLRDAAENDDWKTIDTALRLFDPDFTGDENPQSNGHSEKTVRERVSNALDAND